jgi:hypothetical protein
MVRRWNALNGCGNGFYIGDSEWKRKALPEHRTRVCGSDKY